MRRLYSYSLAAFVLAAILLVVGCKKPAETMQTLQTTDKAAIEKVMAQLTVTSSSFAIGSPIPSQFTCDGEDYSPQIAWGDVPANAQYFALICEDNDAPGGKWVHWIIYDIPASTTSLPERVGNEPTLPDGSKQGKNDSQKIGYTGPCPPPGAPHRYEFKVFALDAATGLEPGAVRLDLLKAMKGHIIRKGEIMGTYQKS